MRLRFKVFISLFILFLISCNTNRQPDWVENPPVDDELYIYVVGVGESEDNSIKSIIEQLSVRFNFKDNEILKSIFLDYINESYYYNLNSSKASILDEWRSPEGTVYFLSQFRREFFEPVITLYTTRYSEMVEYSSDFEIEGDSLYSEGELFKAAQNYLEALEYMLEQDDFFYNESIVRVLNKLIDIFKLLNYSSVDKFSSLKIAHPLNEETLIVNYDPEVGLSLDGFIYVVKFVEGMEPKDRITKVPIRNNKMKFVPPAARVSGTFNFSTILNLESFTENIRPYSERDIVGKNITAYIEVIDEVVVNSRINFSYEALSDVRNIPKLIVFTDSDIRRGVVEFLSDYNAYEYPEIQGDENLISYVREVNLATENSYRYMITERNLVESRESFEAGSLITLKGSIVLIDLINATILTEREIDLEFLTSDGNDIEAYSDFSNKIGEIIYNLSF